ncbi:hypothetical protein SAY86_020022 [Trapa natans]|uniref:Uncharacterized protein n=1 Tax=Trapa natans TaxID=22666 RepID=A0AAN7R7C1_TRANT|nr:hypothetical protein SAY86_020022 [Trapa natans]
MGKFHPLEEQCFWFNGSEKHYPGMQDLPSFFLILEWMNQSTNAAKLKVHKMIDSTPELIFSGNSLCVHGCSEKRSDGLNHNVSDFRADRKRLLLHSSYSNCGYLPKMKLKMALVRTSDSAEKVIGGSYGAMDAWHVIL